MTVENPYRAGAYHWTVATIKLMGINKAHKFSAFAARLQKVWQKADAEGWHDFKNRKPKNAATAKDLDGRMLQNCRVLQRVKNNSYGTPLLKAGAVIDLTRDAKGGLMIALNTKSKKPLKPGRTPKPYKPEPKPANSKAKSTRKATGGKNRAQNRTVKAAGPSPIPSGSGQAPKSLTDSQSQAN